MAMFFIVLFIWFIVAFCGVFHKFGIGWWKGLIPFYNVGLLFKYITGTVKTVWALIGVFAIDFVYGCLGVMYPKALITNIILYVTRFLVLVVYGYIAYKIGEAFEKNGKRLEKYSIWLMLFPDITMSILAFGSAKYVGINNVTWKYEKNTKEINRETQNQDSNISNEFDYFEQAQNEYDFKTKR
ncbi:MAG: DUF5684 domain-containing protein [Lachnospiraceae bacterium]|jgi:hypothetical protein|nr:DUF5684 domain-containing protein [Lachnospiraceae bacterium]